MSRRGISIWAATGIILLHGCAVGPAYKRPKTDDPPTFRGQSQRETNSFADLPWWRVFHDPVLTNLVTVALTHNFDLRIAITRVEQERSLLAEARSQFYPRLDYNAVAGRGRNVTVGNVPSDTGVEGNAFAGYLSASWEIDIFGRIRRMTEAARAQYFATEEARHDISALVVADVAQGYFQLLALDQDLAVAYDTTNSFGQSLKIFSERLQNGVASKLETSAAEALLDSAAATIPILESQIATQENALSLLLGLSPRAVLRNEVAFQDQLPPEVPAGLPSKLLERRPDIREAEQIVRSANAQVGVAQANFFPDLTLTGLLGRVSPEVSVFTGGGATAWSIAAGLTGPLFHGGAIRAEYRRTKAQFDQYVLQYKETVLRALQEVSNTLIAHEKLAFARTQQYRAVMAYKEAVKVAMQRYQVGNASYYEVLLQQQQLFPAENTLVQTELSQLVNLVQLYRALGGGWKQ